VKRPLTFWGVALLLPILHFLLQVGFGLGARAPDLLTVALLIVAREVRTGTAAGIGVAFGLLEDSFSVLAFGANAVAMCLVAILGSRSKDLFVGESLLFLGSYLVLGTWLRHALHWVLAGDIVRVGGGQQLLIHGPAAALYAAAAGILILLGTGVWRGEPAS
jgi:rod shape-determining protein MreD